MAIKKSIIFTLILIQVFFGVNFISSQVILDNLSPLAWTGLRFFMAAILLLLANIFFKRTKPTIPIKDVIYIVFISIIGMGAGQLLFMYAIKFSTGLNVSIISSLIPVMTFFILAILRLEKMHHFKLIGLVVSLIGLIITKDFSQLDFSSKTFIGDLMALLGVISISIFIALLKPMAEKYDHLWLTVIGFFSCGLFFIYFYFNEHQSLMLKLNLVFTLNAAFSIIVGTVLTYLMSSWVLSHVNSSYTAIYINLQPVVAAILSYLYFDQSIHYRLVIGAIIIFVGIVIATRSTKFTRI
jgi:drug/metabolite transporter (DMT)-like permease